MVNLNVAAVDFFCGIGGLTHGLIKADIPVVAGIDIDETCKYAYEENNDSDFIHADITNLTGKEVNDSYPEPVTLAHLLTHTAGFEDRWIGQKTFNEDEVMQLGQFMASNIPDRVIVPGSVHSYSNYGTNLVGYLVEQVSGMSFSEYADENIFHPPACSAALSDSPSLSLWLRI